MAVGFDFWVFRYFEFLGLWRFATNGAPYPRSSRHAPER